MIIYYYFSYINECVRINHQPVNACSLLPANLSYEWAKFKEASVFRAAKFVDPPS